MPAPLTIILPTLNAAQSLGPTLACLFDGVQAGLVHQVIFADGGSDDTTLDIAAEIGAGIIKTAPGRGIQLAQTAKHIKSDWVLFLHADTRLSPNWVQVVENHIANTQTAGYFRLQFDTTGLAPKIVAGWANLRSALFGLPYGDQGMLISKDLYQSIGGYPEIPLMEDVALARKLRGRLTRLPATAITSADKYVQQGWIKRGARNLATLFCYFMGKSPEVLAASYRKE